MRHISFRCLFLVFFVMVPAIFVFAQDRNVLASQIDTAEIRITHSSDLEAYHSRMPLSTMLKVTNLDNFRTVEVRVMGRASGSPGQVIQLSEEAARMLGFSEGEQIPVRVDIISGQASATIPLESFNDSVAQEGSDSYNDYETEEPPAIASATPWEDEDDDYDDYEEEDYAPPVASLEPAPVRPAPPPPPAASVAPAPVAPPPPPPPVRTVLPEQPPRPATTAQPQAGAPDSAQPNIRVTVNINGRDYVFEIPNDGQPHAVSVPPAVSYYPPAAPPAYVPPPPAVSPPPSPPSGNSATIIPNMPDPNSNALYRVQVGSFENRNLARAVFDRLKNAGFNPSYEPYNNMFRVVIPGIRAADMPQVARRLGAAGFSSAWIRREN